MIFSLQTIILQKKALPLRGQSFEFQEAWNYSLINLREKVPSEVVTVNV